MSTASPHTPPRVALLRALIAHPRRLVVGGLVLTVVLLVAGIQSAPDTDASFNPDGDVFETEDFVQRTFRPSTAALDFIVTDESGDALDAETLREWHANVQALRSDPELAPALSTYFDGDLNRTVTGVYSLADAVDAALLDQEVPGGLATATDAQVKRALSAVLDPAAPTAEFRDALSVRAERASATAVGTPITLWSAPAFIDTVRVDRAAFPVDLEQESDPATRTDTQQDAIEAEREVEIEEWARDAQEVLRGDESSFTAWGVAIDQLLTSDESFESTIPFLLGAILVIVLLVGALLRSYWAAALAGAGLALTLLLARSISNILGFEDSIVLDVIVPIATISFGVDFLIHAVGRCREELAAGADHRSAYVVGMSAVGGALVLALSTSSIAFGSNATSGIPGVVQFGFGAAIALGCAFLVLGVFSPLLLLRIEERLQGAPRRGGRRHAAMRGARLVLAALVAGVVIVAAIATPAIAFVAFLAYGLLFLLVPFWWSRRRVPVDAGRQDVAAEASSLLAGRAVAFIVRARYPVLALIGGVTAVAIVGATQVGTKTEPRDFVPSDTDFITSIDTVLAHSTTLGAGEVYILAQGDLADPRVLTAIPPALAQGADAGGDLFARNPDGTPVWPDTAVDVAQAAIAIDFAAAAVAETSGVPLTDADGDGLPDTPAQVAAVFDYAAAHGIPADGSTFVYTADEVSELLTRTADGWATVLRFPIQGFLEADEVAAARAAVAAAAAQLTETAAAAGLAIETAVSGDAVTEQERIDAITDAMVISIPLAVVLCVIAAALVMRSPRLSLVSVVPILLVIAWLLGFMALTGYDLNVITATIAAISVGVGIDYSIHYTMRFREELAVAGSRLVAAQRAAEGTGMALVLSGLTSVLGFAFLAFAPMPIFAAYGLLTAVMIAFSLAAALTVLPALLYLVSARVPSGVRESVGVMAQQKSS